MAHQVASNFAVKTGDMIETVSNLSWAGSQFEDRRDPRMQLAFILNSGDTREEDGSPWTSHQKGSTARTFKMIAKRAWTSEEDDLLRDLVKKHGARNWKRLAVHFPGREGYHVRAHYKHSMENLDSKRPFTPEDDAALLSAFEEIGPRWAQIARSMDRRIDNDVKNRYRLLMRHKKFLHSKGH
mmetsp:Transcript_5226/g.11029  ORF Transcript_5226/g.11029 Transcript_5226/m.11029 type:complete len:183 (-) Transcript_5226:114-662(-)